MESAMMRRADRFYHRILRCKLTRGLQLFLESRFRICGGGGHWIRLSQLFTERAINERGRCLKPAIEKNCAGNRFEDIRQQSPFAPAAAFFLSSTKANEFTQSEIGGRLCQRRRAHQPMLHA